MPVADARFPDPALDPEGAWRLAQRYIREGRLADARDICRRILANWPAHVRTLSLLGVLEQHLGHKDSAINLLRRAVDLEPGSIEAQRALGVVLCECGDFEAAIAAFRRTIALQPDDAEIHARLGEALERLGQIDLAIASLRQAIALNPNLAEAYSILGTALWEKGLGAEAIVALRQAVALRPNWPEPYCNLGNLLHEAGRFDEAIAATRRALELRPSFPEAYCTMASVLAEQGLLDLALDAYNKALSYDPNHELALSSRVYTMLFHPSTNSSANLEAARDWARRCADHLKPKVLHHQNDRSPARRLRIGYVSPDFRRHAAASFLLPLLRHHDPRKVEVICYSNTRFPDDLTRQMQSLVSAWGDVVSLSDAQLAQRVYDDRIDILVDLAQHTSGGRLLTFARKPAPIQVTWLGYPGTTGLGTIDYRITDPYLDPPGTDAFYVEESVRLPRCFWCYAPAYATPQIQPPPSLANGHITFGCLNTFRKVTPLALRTWCALLQRTPGSVLLLHARPGGHRQRVLDLLASEGVDPNRLEFVDKVSAEAYFSLYDRIDIALDPFPYSGGTTTCDALWMGVPVIGLSGQTAVARGSWSILSNVELAELVAQDPGQYIEIASTLAADRDRLQRLRKELRPRMQSSALMDGSRFTGDLEAAYRGMWERWCERA